MTLFRSPTPDERRQHILTEAEFELIQAERMYEYYLAMRTMLERRIARLRTELAASTQTTREDTP